MTAVALPALLGYHPDVPARRPVSAAVLRSDTIAGLAAAKGWIDGLGKGGRVMATLRRFARPGLLLWLNTATTIRARMERRAEVWPASRLAGEEATVRPEDTLRAAGISSKRQANYQRRMSKLLAGEGTS